MNMLMILKGIAAIGTAATGLYSLISPTAIYNFTGIMASGPRGITEIRSIFGALFIALGVAPFLFGEDGYRILGLGYLAIAIVRIVFIFVDKSAVSSNWISLAVEIVFGFILIIRK